MGGIAAAYVDYDKRFDLKDQYPRSQTINFVNPASYSRYVSLLLTLVLK
jgi:hypothetical protein